MFAQLGTTIFDGAKSFLNFSDDQEPIVVEHAVMGRAPVLQGAGLGARNLSISLFLHQEYCVVADEITKLKKSATTFEILPLLWGNGKTEGYFVIISISVSVSQMDGIGNMIAATVSISLKEDANDDRLNKKQTDAKNSAFAVGDKTPPAKSKRVNATPCNQQISRLVSGLKALAGAADRECQGYTNTPKPNARLKYYMGRINEDSQKIIAAAGNPSSCASSVPGLGSAANNVKAKSVQLQADIRANETQYPNLVVTPVNLTIKGHNKELQDAVRDLDSKASTLVKSSIVKK